MHIYSLLLHCVLLPLLGMSCGSDLPLQRVLLRLLGMTCGGDLVAGCDCMPQAHLDEKQKAHR